MTEAKSCLCRLTSSKTKEGKRDSLLLGQCYFWNADVCVVLEKLFYFLTFLIGIGKVINGLDFMYCYNKLVHLFKLMVGEY